MLEKENSLPGAECHPAVHDRNDFAGPRESHSDVTWHVVGTFLGVDEPRGGFWDEFFEKHLQVTAGTGIGVFHDDEAGAGMPDENGDRAILDSRL